MRLAELGITKRCKDYALFETHFLQTAEKVALHTNGSVGSSSSQGIGANLQNGIGGEHSTVSVGDDLSNFIW